MFSYFNILETDEHNCAASLGIANILNEYGKTIEANEVERLINEFNFIAAKRLINT